MENYYMGIDVSKGYADFVILDTSKTIVEPNFQLDNTLKRLKRELTVREEVNFYILSVLQQIRCHLA